VRVGGPHKKARKTVKISETHNEKLIAMAQSAKQPTMTKRDFLEYLIDLCDEFHFEKPGWRERFNEGLDKIDAVREKNRFDVLDDSCPAFQLVDEFFMCIWAKKDSPPKSKKLSKDLTEALKVCQGCVRTREILEGIEGYEETIRSLKAKAKSGIVVSIPRCDFPSELSDDGLSFWCSRQQKYMTVEKCKTLRKGQPCRNLKWIKVPVKGELAEPEK